MYRENHTWGDDLRFIRPASLADSLPLYLQVLDVLENDALYVNLFPKGEPPAREARPLPSGRSKGRGA